MKKGYLHALKGIGILLFVWIVAHIDRTHILEILQGADASYAALSLVALFAIYVIKTCRWHLLAVKAGSTATFYESWKVYLIGIFFATVTPAKIGEFGRAIYLKKQGMNTVAAVGTAIADRVLDAIVIGILTIPSLWILFGKLPALELLAAAVLVCGLTLLFLLRTTLGAQLLTLVPLLRTVLLTKIAWLLLGYTLLSWCTYYIWILLIAASLHMTVPPVTLIAACTIAGIIALLPIAPSGLGTRDAALIYLLAPFGVLPESAVGLAFMMFVSILLSGIPGSFYWIKGLR